MPEPHPFEDPARRCLPLAQWPEPDRTAWEAAMAPGDILDGTVGPGFHWVAETREKYRKDYGRWLTFLIRAGLLGSGSAPGERVRPDQIRAYILELQTQNVGGWTLWGRLAELLAVMKAIEPDGDFGWLRKVVPFYEGRATNRRNKFQRLQPAHTILDWALKRINRVTVAPPQRDEAGAYRDALMVALLSSCPIRLRNLTMIESGQHLHHTGSGYILRFAASETKTGHPITSPIPDSLTGPLDYYLASIRPELLGANRSTRLWIRRYGKPMTAKSIHLAITRTTERAFGQPINPHLFRDCAATFVATEDPEHVGIAAPLLGHIDPRATERHYIHANQIAADRRIRQSVATLRNQLSKPLPKKDQP